MVRLMSGASMNQKNPSAPKDDMADTPLGVDTIIAAMVPDFGSAIAWHLEQRFPKDLTHWTENHRERFRS